jgi:arylsulfatase A-like enzyme
MLAVKDWGLYPGIAVTTSRSTIFVLLAAVPGAAILAALIDLATLPHNQLGPQVLAASLGATMPIVWPVMFVIVGTASLLVYGKRRKAKRIVVALACAAALTRYARFPIAFGLLGCSTAASFLALSKAGTSQVITWSLAIFALLWIILATVFGFGNLNSIYPTLLEALYLMRYIGCHVLIACLLHLCATRWPRCPAGFGIASLVLVFIRMAASAADAVDTRKRGWVRSQTTGGLVATARTPVQDECHEANALSPQRAEEVFTNLAGYPSLPQGLDPSKYNILLVTVEALRFDHTSLGGSDLTPALGGLAAESFQFSRAYSPASRTILTLGSLFTMSPSSLAPLTIGVPGWIGELRSEAETLAELFSSAGFRTIAIRHDQFFEHSKGFDQGFDSVHKEPVGVHPRRIIDENIAELARQSISSNAEQPFFMWVFFASPHHPYVAASGGPRARYAASVAHADAQLGVLLAALDDAKIRDKTIVIVTSDHGEELGEHGTMGTHGITVNSEVLRVPLVVHIPGFEEQQVDKPVSIANVFPWLLLQTSSFRQAVLRRLQNAISPALAATDGAVVGELFDANTDLLTLVWPSRKLDANLRAGIYHLYDANTDPYDKHDVLEEQPRAVSEGIDEVKAFRSLRACSRRAQK